MDPIRLTRDGAVQVIELPALTALRIDPERRVVAIDGMSGTPHEPLDPEWTVLDLRDGIYGGFHRLRPADECFDAECAASGQHGPRPSAPGGLLARLAELLPGPCPEPGIADGNDMCPCGSGPVWPCDLTRAAWLLAGLDPEVEIRKVLDEARRQTDAYQADWEALHDRDPEAARRQGLRDLGWDR